MKKLKLIAIFSGSASSLRFLFTEDSNYGINYEFVCGVSNKKETKGEVFCLENGIEFIHFNTKRFCIDHGYTGPLWDMPEEIRVAYFSELLELIKPFNPDAIILSGFMLEIPEPLLGYYPMLNVHPADLRIKDIKGKPRFTGDNAVADAIHAGEKTTASTIHYVEKEVDCGEIICVSDPLFVEEGVTVGEHQEKMKFACDGPAYKKALEILYSKFN